MNAQGSDRSNKLKNQKTIFINTSMGVLIDQFS
jgi:hypothetical protein